MGILRKLFGKRKKVSDECAIKIYNEMSQEIFVENESAYRNQHLVFRRSIEANRITLGELLEKIFQMDKLSVQSMAVAYHQQHFENSACEQIIEDPEEIWYFDLFSCILKRKTEDGLHYTDGMFHETTLIVKSKGRNCVFVLSSLGGTKTAKYMRVSVLSPNNFDTDDGRSFNSQNAATVMSFILSYTEVVDNPDFQTVSLLEKSVEKKLEKGKNLTKQEQNCYYGQLEFRWYYNYGYGKWLFEQKRYYDSYTKLLRVFNLIKSPSSNKDSCQMDIFYDICNLLGKCLLKLERYDEAYFFFRQGAPALTLEEPYWSALCHAKLGNPSAVNVMNEWLLSVAQEYGESENWSKEICDFTVQVPVDLMQYKKKIDAALSSDSSYNENITIGFVLQNIWGLENKNLIPCMFIYDVNNNSFLKRIEDVDEISNYVLNVENARDKIFILSCTHVYNNKSGEEDLSILSINAPIVIFTNSIKDTSKMRVDMLRHNFSNNDEKRTVELINMPLNATFSMETENSNENKTYSADRKGLANGIKKAAKFIEERRFVEALKLAQWIYECCSNMLKDEMGLEYVSNDEVIWNIFYESCYYVGFCLMELGKAYAALFYLEISAESMNTTIIKEYINCLANTQDLNALNVVEDVMQHLSKPNVENEVAAFNDFMSFLKRRKAYMLIDKKRYDEARKMFTELLDDPLSKDYAKKELQYIEGLDGNEIEE